MSLASNVAMLVRNWTGSLPPPVIRRAAATRWSSAAPAPRRLELRIAAVRQETPSVVTLELEPTEGAALAYEAGQHLTLLVDTAAGTARRCYSFSTSPLADGRAAVSIRRVEGGAVSPLLHALVPGAVLAAAPPSGNFTLAPLSRGERRLVFVGGGVGLTPLVSLAETALRRDPDAEVLFLAGHRNASENLFAERLAALVAAFGPRLRVVTALEDAPAGWDGLSGMMGGARVLELAGADFDACYVCGPEAMMDDVASALGRAGVPASRVRSERFSYAAPGQANPPSTPREIGFARSGRTVVAEPGETVLQAAARAGIALPSSCTMGGCGACKVKKTAGTVVSAEPNCLTEAEKADGYLLACCSWADDGLVLADY